MALAGKLWGLPTTVLGLLFALPALAARGRARRRGNALEVLGHPWMPRGCAVTLGHVVCYARDARPESPMACGTLGEHEHQHTLQAERLGPFYLPLHLACGLLALARDGRWHGPGNRLETGPLSRPPRPWA